MTWLMYFVDNAWKATAILAAAFAAGAALRKSPAAWRHFVWTAAFAALMALPAVMPVAPKWSPRAEAPRVTVTAVSAAARPAVPVNPGKPVHAASNPTDWALMFWLAGCAAAAGWFLLGALRTFWMVRRACASPGAQAVADGLRRTVGIGREVRVLETADVPMPFTWGLRRPVVLLPEGARAWPGERLTAVLLHELVHIHRLDLATQAVAQMACCLYWFHPLAWLGLRELRRERECACDDAVLLHGVPAHDYAAHLVALVRGLAARRSLWAGAPAAAETSDLETRVRAMLDRGRDRHPLSRRAALAVAAAAIAVVAPLAVITAHAQPARGTLAGVVTDASGARVPMCRVVAKSLDGSRQEVATANPAGEYRLAGIPSDHYTLEFLARGFARTTRDAVLGPGATLQVDVTLDLGQVQETMSIKAQRLSPAAGLPSSAAAQRIRVGGSVTAAKLIRQVRPVYPPELQSLGIAGTVVVKAVISKDGAILNPQVLNTVDPRLAQAVIDAVSQWRYEPTLLNGNPVEVVTTITVGFDFE